MWADIIPSTIATLEALLIGLCVGISICGIAYAKGFNDRSKLDTSNEIIEGINNYGAI